MSNQRKMIKARCAICGRRLREGAYTHSRWTGNHYCAGAAYNSCDAIHKRQQRQQRKAATV